MDLTSSQQAAKNKAKEFFFPGQIAGSFSTGVESVVTAWPISENIVGIGIGAKMADGIAIAGVDSVHVYVRAKIPKAQLSGDERIPAKFGKLPTDVIEVGDIIAFQALQSWQRFGRNRPTSCGVSVGHPNVTAGTLGCIVEKNDKHYILSNNHVLADCNRAVMGDRITQPGSADRGVSPADDLATLSDFRPIDFTGTANEIDAAIALIGDSTQKDVEPEIIDIGRPLKTTKPAAKYQSVRKHGRTTGHTVGVVMSVSVDLWVNYGGAGRAWFEDQISIMGVGSAPFSQGGDSGSLIVDAVSLEPVGLLFAGGSQLTLANPIDKVFSHFSVSVVG